MYTNLYVVINYMYKKGFTPSSLTGFTLMEIIMAVVILSVIMLGLVSVFVSGKKLIRHGRARMTAAELGKLFLDPLQMKVRQDTWATSCINQQNCANETVGTANGLDRDYTVNYTINTNAPLTNLNRVKAEIKWYANESP